MDRSRVLMVARAVSIVVVLAAIVAQAAVLIDNDAFDPSRFFAYFTIQSNVIGVAAFAWLLVARGRPRSRTLESFRGAAASYLTVTFLVVIALLQNVDVALGLQWVDIVLHKIFPVIFVLDFLLDPPGVRLSMRDAAAWMVYPLIWTGLTLVRGAADGWYPYPFLNPANGGYGSVALMVVAITAGFLVIAAVYIWLGNNRARAVAQPV